MTKLIADYEAEIAMLTESYQQNIRHSIALLQDRAEALRAGGKASTHLGYNLANRAHELSVLAAKIEQTEMTLRVLKGMAK